ncbi:MULTISPECIES: type I polyketide synthase [unclassified Streptomyces]|uniref:type I polyketide synthase n=1 Tax=unclassified Streptomyces TaxID=2593676 RepID=UPI0022B60080|nr:MULTISPECIES: beta-ketoacyl synthase N-terminal-like domain-containing protein [unclassified Streptomyces]MCZ7413945.1 beta-ketoacyl synthase N-terminal-like domain-containing protein [Streptomyces sp. WMMC897]MCZ7430941.1 beta-ketoacyl synthase N-terminal-like domain-containing protein [Streptomyces sp. WMMC1477]
MSAGATRRRIALVGMALRLPGADSPEAFWHTIRSGTSHIRRYTPEELVRAGVPRETAEAEGFVGATATIPGIDRFDAPFFSMSGTEAELTDPQQRLFLECAHHALEHAGYAGGQRGLRTAVYASTGYHLYGLRSYLHQQSLAGPDDGGWMYGLHRTVGGYADFTASRTAFRLGLTGPAVGVQTACSSSLAAVHLARQALLTGDADLALVGAAALHVPQVLGYPHVKGSILSRTGRCLPFSAEADGTVGGNGVAAVVLKRLDRALADGDTVHAVLRGTALNNDGGAKRHFTEPSARGQRAVIRAALAAAETTADRLGYVETHGTGTYKGDPIEYAALARVHREQSARTGYCALGSVKANIGHLDVCSGLAGLIKAALVVRYGTIPPLAGLTAPNPLLTLEGGPFRLPARAHRWPEGDGPRLAGLTSLGVGGTNAHAIVEQPPSRAAAPGTALPTGTARPTARTPAPPAPAAPAPPAAPAVSATRAVPAVPAVPAPGVVPLSGRDHAALVAGARRLRRHLALHPDVRQADLATTLGLGRRALRHRLALTGEDPAGVARSLDAFLAAGARDEDPASPAPASGDGWSSGVTPRAEQAPLAWVFSGQGGARRGMARELYARFAPVREVLDACEEQYRDAYDASLLAELLGTEGDRPPGTGTGQPALYALQAAQVRLWRELGPAPDLVAGHSVGDFAALHAAGVLSLTDGLRLTAERGRLMERECAPGGMLAVFTDRAAVDALLARHPRLCLAVVNGERHHVVAGPGAVVDEAARDLAGRNTRSRRLAVDRAFHSRLVDPVLPALRTLADTVGWAPARVPHAVGPDGGLAPAGSTPDGDWLARHARESVRFDRVLTELTAAGCGLVQELGPDAVLSGLAARESPRLTALPTQRPRAGTRPLWHALGAHYCRGYPVHWAELLEGCGGGRIPLPGYAFQRRRYWTGPALAEPTVAATPGTDEGDGETMRELEPILADVRARTATHLGVDVADCDPEVPFFDLGADSLQMINMLQELEHGYGVKVGMRELFEEADTPLRLARLIVERGGRAAEAPATDATAGATPATEAPDGADGSVRPPRAPAAAVPTPPAAAPAAREAGPAPGEDAYATRAQLADLSARIEQLAEHQAQLMRQLTLLLDAQLAARPNGQVAR